MRKKNKEKMSKKDKEKMMTYYKNLAPTSVEFVMAKAKCDLKEDEVIFYDVKIMKREKVVAKLEKYVEELNSNVEE